MQRSPANLKHITSQNILNKVEDVAAHKRNIKTKSRK